MEKKSTNWLYNRRYQWHRAGGTDQGAQRSQDPNYCTPVIFGSNKVLSFYKKLLDAEHFKYAHCDQVSDANPKLINVINTLPEEFIPDPAFPVLLAGRLPCYHWKRRQMPC